MPIEGNGPGDGAVGSGDLLRHVFDAAPSAMLLVDRGGSIRLANRHCLDLFGYLHEQLVGEPVEVLVPERFRERHPERRDGYFGMPAVRAMGAGRDLYGRRRDGSEVPIEIGLNPLHATGELFVVASIIDITQRKIGEDRLRASLAEKETLLREIHHRVKNNMQVVSSMLNLQTNTIDEPRYRAMFEECQARVHAMAMIHEKLYASDNLAALDGGDYVADLARMLVRSYARRASQVDLQVDAEALGLDIQTAIPIGLILNEFVTNALKHAFPAGRGMIRVGLHDVGDDRAALEVRDDGAGIGDAIDYEQSRGLGLRLVRGLVRQLDGTLHRLPGPGTGFRVEFVRRFRGELVGAAPDAGQGDRNEDDHKEVR
ncbi:MAG: PAS domain S-box protein [Planctomycetes bacterium]|nr:PAS domain S-box protein [Planctomycetota bacterium]MCB9886886.1 PAS domain S-box protein [Planctomycetota bacterium]